MNVLNGGGASICDSCSNFMKEAYLIYILNSAYCKKCFEDWKERSIKYDSDLQLQKENHINYYKAHLLEFEE